MDPEYEADPISSTHRKQIFFFSLEFDPQDFIFILTTLKNIIDSRKLWKEYKDLHIDGGLLKLPLPRIGEHK